MAIPVSFAAGGAATRRMNQKPARRRGSIAMGHVLMETGTG